MSTAALVCTAAAADTLHTQDDLNDFVETWEYSGSREHTRDELNAVQNLRPTLRKFWTNTRDEAATLVNNILDTHQAVLQLVRHDGLDWHIHATSPDQPLHVRMAVESAIAMADLIRTDSWDRLQMCAADDCDGVLVDLSKNRSKRYCELGCGNRTHAAAYRARKAERAE